MGKISIVDLEVRFKIGVTDEERAQPQRLLITVIMDYDITSAAVTDRVTKTIDYAAVAQRIVHFGETRSWRLLEKLVTEIADLVLTEFQPQNVIVEAKKFSLPQAHHTSVALVKGRTANTTVKRAAWGIP